MKRLLLVDDDPAILDSLLFVLEESYELETARDGAAALQRMEEARFDLVLLDLMMPNMDGATLLRHLRDVGDTTPVIISSASMNLAARAKELCATDFVAKPFDLDELEEKIARAIAAGGAGPGGGSTPTNETPNTGRSAGDAGLARLLHVGLPELRTRWLNMNPRTARPA